MNEPPTFTGIPCRGCFFTPMRTGCLVVHSLGKGEEIMVQREPTNPYDSNAIQVLTLDGIWFGYIGKEYAAEIAPWMDAGWFFLAWKTGKVKCQTILTLEPIKSAKKTQETSHEQDTPFRILLPQEH